jgi:hypothetical protein
MNIGFSRTLAIIFGVGLPMLGIVRHWTSANGDPSGFFVDLLNGAFLLFGAWKVGEKERSGQRFLAAAWGLTIGLYYSSLAEQIDKLKIVELVEAPISPEWVLAATSLGLLIAVIGLISSLRSTRKH